MTYRLTYEAVEDVLRVLAESGNQFGLHQAEIYYTDLEASFQFLAENPRAARERTEINPPVRVHPFQSHVIVYRVDGDDVSILGVRHSRENWLNDDWSE